MKHLAAVFLWFAVMAHAEQNRPVLVELFTSEGCSSCPPADALLEELDKTQPVPGTEILVLSEHVDYWDQIGWRDRFSSPLFTARQRSYGDRFHLDEVYTPQIVVDGAAEVLGSDKAAALRAVKQASRAEKLGVSLTALPNARATLKIEPLPALVKGDATVFVAVADEEDTSDIHGGENKGRRLHHVSVVRSLTAIGKITAKDGFSKELALGDHPEHARLVAFVQESKQGRILGSAMLAR
jgi:hypothetical protein